MLTTRRKHKSDHLTNSSPAATGETRTAANILVHTLNFSSSSSSSSCSGAFAMLSVRFSPISANPLNQAVAPLRLASISKHRCRRPLPGHPSPFAPVRVTEPPKGRDTNAPPAEAEWKNDACLVIDNNMIAVAATGWCKGKGVFSFETAASFPARVRDPVVERIGNLIRFKHN